MPNPFQFLSAVRQDALYAVRSFRRNPGFVAVAVTSLALGIAANTTIFSVANAMLFGGLPVQQPQRLISIGNSVHGFTLSYPDYLDFKRETRLFEGIEAHFPLAPASLGGVSEPERIWGQLVSGNYFSVVQPEIILGRGFLPEEDKNPGQYAVAVLSYQLWQRRFHGDPTILGKNIVLNNLPYEIVGVTGQGFHGTERAILPEFFVPLAMAVNMMPTLATAELREDHRAQWLALEGRLKPGASREQAQAELQVINRRLDETYKPKEPRSAIVLTDSGGLPAGGSLTMGRVMMAVMAVVGLVLLIACANVANLLLARASARQKEISVRLAVGASRSRLMRQLLTESVLLALLGAACGIALTFAATDALTSLELPIPIPLALNFSPDLRVLLYTLCLAVITGVSFGFAPALRATKTDLLAATKQDGASLGRLRRFSLRNVLVIGQVAASLALLIAAGLALRSLQSASLIDIGMRPGNMLLMSVDPQLHNYSAEQSRQFFARLQERLKAVPGIQQVSYTDVVPLSIGGVTMGFHKHAGETAKPELIADVYTVGDDYFETIGTPLLQGVGFHHESATSQPLAVVNEAFAKKMYPGEDAIGRTAVERKETYRIVGIVKNSASQMLSVDAKPCLFRSMNQGAGVASDFLGVAILIKTASAPAAFAPAVREQVRALDRNMAVFNIETMSSHLSKALMLPRLAGVLFSLFGIAGLLLAMVGLYGVMSYVVRRRTREIGIRMALGAERGLVLRLVAGQGLLMAGIGSAIGLAVSFLAARVAASVLFGISSTDTVTFLCVPAALLAVAALAIFIPARKAASVDPLTALRYE